MTTIPRLAGALALAACASALAQTPSTSPSPGYPSKPIKWVVPYTPGGITDSVTRLVAQKLQDSLGQPIVIENKPGANSIVGAEMIAKSPPDGYNMLTVIAAHAANVTLYAGKLPFDPVKSFVPVSLVAVAPLILTVNNDFPAHLTTELLKQTADVKMVHVPYKGTAPALQGLLSGDIQVLVDVPSSLMPHVRAGKIRALGMFSAKRVSGAPEVPTVAEAGGPAIEGSTWVLFLAPAGTPREIVQRLSSETAKIVAGPDLRARFEQLGIEPVGSTPEQASAFLNEEIAKWAKVITTAGVKAE
jgi:tripartite-type tricarboxylate transporter receptor subunit TctC